MKRPLALALIFSAPFAVFAQRGGGGNPAPAPQVSRGAYPTAAPAPQPFAPIQLFALPTQYYSAPVQQSFAPVLQHQLSSSPAQHYSATTSTYVHHSYAKPAITTNILYAGPSFGVSFGVPGFNASIYSTGSNFSRGYSNYGYGLNTGFGPTYYLNNFAYQPSYGPTVPASILGTAIYAHAEPPSATSLMTLVSPNSPLLKAANATAELDYLGRGQAFLKDGKYPEAIKALRHAIVDDPQNPTIAATAAVALALNNNFEEATGAAQQALALLAPEKWATEVPASFKGLKTADAEAALRKRIGDKPNEAGYRFLAGYLGFANGEFKRSLADFEGVLKLVPNDPLATKLRDAAAKAADAIK